MLICHICEEKAVCSLDIDAREYVDHLYFCEKHKPVFIRLKEMDEKQSTRGMKVILDTQTQPNKSEGSK